jgi:putative FmdB family regulatory protein
MPIYEYKAAYDACCQFCKGKFEVRQGMNDEPLTRCPRCGSAVKRLFSRPFISLKETLFEDETFDTYTEEEADGLGLEGGFAEDQIWD